MFGRKNEGPHCDNVQIKAGDVALTPVSVGTIDFGDQFAGDKSDERMPKIITSALLLLTLCESGLPQKSCECRGATEADKTIWEHIATQEEEARTVKKVHGVVRNPLGERLDDALVEVFADDGTEDTPTSPKNRRVAACVTGEKGKFCFDGLKPGKYILAVGRQGFNITFIKLNLDPKGRRNSGKPLDVSLALGT
jgi:hypothetical protein